MTTKNISLTEHYSELVDTLVASGRYKNASEVVREGLRLLEQRTTEDERRLELLQQLAAEDFDSSIKVRELVLRPVVRLLIVFPSWAARRQSSLKMEGVVDPNAACCTSTGCGRGHCRDLSLEPRAFWRASKIALTKPC